MAADEEWGAFDERVWLFGVMIEGGHAPVIENPSRMPCAPDRHVETLVVHGMSEEAERTAWGVDVSDDWELEHAWCGRLDDDGCPWEFAVRVLEVSPLRFTEARRLARERLARPDVPEHIAGWTALAYP